MGDAKTQLSRRDLEAALGLVHRVEAVPDLASFREEALAGLRRLVPFEFAGYNEIEPIAGTAVLGEHPSGFLSSDQVEAFTLYMDQHPVLAHVARTRDPTPRRISDFIGRRTLHHLDLYDGVFRPSGLEGQIVVTLEAAEPLVIGISLNRASGDFSDRDRDLLAVLRPHLSAARRNAELRQLHLAAERLPEGAPGIALISKAGPILTANRVATALLAAYFDGTSRPPYLPTDLERWVAVERDRRAGDRPAGPSGELRVDADRGTLAVRFLPGRQPTEPDALVFSESRPPLDPPTLATLGVTAREIEVLSLIGAGLRNAEIARELFVSPGTVKKHLDNIYGKLGVRNRMAAVARAREICGAAHAAR